MLAPGDPAPPFTLPRDGGGTLSLADLAGRNVVLFFYPGDSTPSCTTEAQDFTALAPRLDAAKAVVIGISSGNVAAKDRFVAKAGLGVPLLADESGEVLRAYGVWQEKTNYGRTYMGIVRTTFLIDHQGRIARIWTVTRVRNHAQEVLVAAEALAAGDLRRGLSIPHAPLGSLSWGVGGFWFSQLVRIGRFPPVERHTPA